MREQLIFTYGLFKESAQEWYKDNAPRLGAALAYYTVFSLAPLLVVAVAMAGFFFGKDAIQGELSLQLQGLIGKDGAHAVEGFVANAWKPSSNLLATFVGLITLLIGSTAVFSELRSVLNQIWNVEPKKMNGLWMLLRDRLLSFAMIGAIGFLLLVSLVMNSLLSAALHYSSGLLPIPGLVSQIVYSLVSFGLITVLFASIYKVLPDAKIEWNDVWVGAGITSFFFAIGKFFIGLYLGRSSLTSSYGASGSLVIIMIWTYYSSMILIYGAEFTEVFARRHGSRRDSPLPLGPSERYAQKSTLVTS